MPRFEATRGLFRDGPRNFEPRSDDEDDTRAGTLSPNFRATPTGGRLASTCDLACNRSHARRIFSGIWFRTSDPPVPRSRPCHARQLISVTWVKAHAGNPAGMILFRTIYAHTHNLNLLDSPNCICGLVCVTQIISLLTTHSLTKDYHLKRPADAHKPTWFKGLLENKPATKLMEAFSISESICASIRHEFELLL
ncbi:hypothetical protein AVEN_233920-1 [Araneus ventricosus]|uniref:RNase H type-1 domain-containing protein n=1 Tax=Araneus ventricosus TaxID=182803 RepID=A0A4Y2LKT5_ARAVE|nr:hypothetical protein AVEN_233920-1 [Araneus ventricosus]